MKGQLKAETHAEYIAQVDDSRKADIAALDALIRKNAPKLTPFMYMGILGYGPQENGCRIGVASNASYISLYVGSIGGKFQDELPKAKIGKGCVRFKRLADLDTSALARMIREKAKESVS